jgi:hypothetical protein
LRTPSYLLALALLATPTLAREAAEASPEADDRPAEAEEIDAILVALAEDEDHAFLATLAPTDPDCAALFRRAEDAELACDYAEAMYAGLDSIPDGAMKPTTEDGGATVAIASAALIEAGMAHPAFAPYAEITPLLARDALLYVFLFEDGEGRPTKTRGVLARGVDRWVFVPQLQRAFEG